eukprot:TRINITY_DN45060_c0_g1_i1.p1 TRINITY_DN45060_c0_g1~~TRINITY_DN45060_c0_g1_i1.p1  ORF type:complete len:304 (+),score=72.28 TRINITY_DN45060_c0_g1_i1:166-1077(+)
MPPPREIVMVSGNRKKIQRARDILGQVGWGVRAEDLNLQEVQSDSVAEVARHKSQQAYALLNHPVMVTDYGLEIDCLNGFPGPYTDFARRTIGSGGLIRLTSSTVSAQPDLPRTCRWNMCIVYVDRHGEHHTFQAPLHGTVAESVTPATVADNLLFVFIPDGYTKPLGELSPEEYARYFASTPCVYHDFASWLVENEAQPVEGDGGSGGMQPKIQGGGPTLHTGSGVQKTKEVASEVPAAGGAEKGEPTLAAAGAHRQAEEERRRRLQGPGGGGGGEGAGDVVFKRVVTESSLSGGSESSRSY